MIFKKLFAFIVAAFFLCGCSYLTSFKYSQKEEITTEIIETEEKDTVDSTDDTFSLISASNGVTDKADEAEQKPDGEVVSELYGSGYSSWQDAYASFVGASYSVDYSLEYALIYLDEDNQPELYFNTMAEAGGEQVLTYSDGKLNYVQLSRIGSEVIPGKGLIYNNCGHMDYYPVYIYKLFQGDFYLLGEGLWGSFDWENGNEIDEFGRIRYQYEWEGTRYTEEEYYNCIDALFPRKEGTRPDTWYNYTELMSVLTTGHHTAFGHSYELICGDFTWQEAQKECINMGGYLATITSPEERQIITELIEKEGKTDCSFYVGFQGFCRINGELQDEGWIEKDGRLVKGHCFDGFDYYFYPGFDFSTQEWDFTLGQIGLMKYSHETGKIYKFEAPMDLLSYAPQYEGKIGFICEFE